MTETERQIERIMHAPVKGLVKLPPVDFQVVLLLILQERLRDWPAKANEGPVEVKIDTDHPVLMDTPEG